MPCLVTRRTEKCRDAISVMTLLGRPPFRGTVKCQVARAVTLGPEPVQSAGIARRHFGWVVLVAAMLLAATPLHGQSADPSALSASGTESNKPAPTLESTMPQSGVLHPLPDATVDNAIAPPNVDPKMQIPPPVAQGTGVKVNPK